MDARGKKLIYGITKAVTNSVLAEHRKVGVFQHVPQNGTMSDPTMTHQSEGFGT